MVAVKFERFGGRTVGVARFELPVPAEAPGVVRRINVRTTSFIPAAIDFLVFGSIVCGPSTSLGGELLYQFSVDFPVLPQMEDHFAGIRLPSM
jgi:hypothetical protein